MVVHDKGAIPGVAVIEELIERSGNRLDIRSTTFLYGDQQKDYTGSKRNLVVYQGTEPVTTLSLGKVLDDSIDERYNPGDGLSYRGAGSLSPQGAGYALAAFPEGESQLYVRFLNPANQPRDTELPLTSVSSLSKHLVNHTDILFVRADTEGVAVTRVPLRHVRVDRESDQQVQHLEVSNEGKLALEATYSPGTLAERGSASPSYYLLAKSETRTYTFAVKAGVQGQNIHVSATGTEGIQLNTMVEGTYTLCLLEVGKDSALKGHPLGQVKVTNQGTPKTAAVLGSCVSRDVFNSNFAPDWKTRNSLVAAAHQSSLISVMGLPLAQKELTFEDLDKHARAVTLDDVNKTVIKTIKEQAPDYVIVDLTSDTRFGVIDLEDGATVSENPWKIAKSKDYQKLRVAGKVSMLTDSETYLRRFRAAVRDLTEQVDQASEGKSTIVLLSVDATGTLRSDDGTVTLKKDLAQIYNTSFEALETAFIEECPDAVVLDMKDKTKWGNRDHLWSAHVVHFEQSYYDALDTRLRDIMGAPRQVELISGTETATSVKDTMNNNICCYWEGTVPPAYLTLCVSTWVKYVDLSKVVILNQSNLNRYIGEAVDINDFRMYSFAKQSDIVSAFYLAKHGGAFIDIDTLMVNEGAHNFLSADSTEDVLRLFGNKKTGGIHIGALSTPAGGNVISYWADELTRRVPHWEDDKSWAYVGNLVIEPYVKRPENGHLIEVIDVNDSYVTPELQGVPDSSLSARQKYEEFWFGAMTEKRREYVDSLTDICNGTISLHNSWTPDWYTRLSVEEILQTDCALSYFFRKNASLDLLPQIEEILKYGSR